jgi:hypothetical protein
MKTFDALGLIDMVIEVVKKIFNLTGPDGKEQAIFLVLIIVAVFSALIGRMILWIISRTRN